MITKGVILLPTGETEEEIAMQDIEKGPPPPMEPTLMDRLPHWAQKGYVQVFDIHRLILALTVYTRRDSVQYRSS